MEAEEARRLTARALFELNGVLVSDPGHVKDELQIMVSFKALGLMMLVLLLLLLLLLLLWLLLLLFLKKKALQPSNTYIDVNRLK